MPSVGTTSGPRILGAYAAGTTYGPFDVVTYNGASYMAVAATTGNLPTNTTYWLPFGGGSSAGVVSTSKWGTD